MRKVLAPQEIIGRHIASDRIIEAALLNGDHKTNNKEVKKLNKLIEPLKDDLELAKHIYCELFKADCVRSRCHAAVECLELGIFIDESLETLESLSKRNDIGITSVSCEWALKQWRGEIPK